MITEEYRTISALNQSKLKLLLKHPLKYLNASEEEGREEDYFTFGQIVEDLLFEKDDYIAEKFCITKAPTPSDAILSVLKLIAEWTKEKYLEKVDPDTISEVCKICEYGQSWKPETAVKKVLEAGTEYYFELKESEGKARVSQEDFDLASKVATEALNNPIVGPLLSSKNTFSKQTLEFTFLGKKCKGEIDLLFVDHENLQARVYDIKTSGQAMYFRNSILKYRYDFQVNFYTIGAVSTGLIPEGYTLLTPQFIVIDSKGNLPCTIWDSPSLYSANALHTLGNDFEYNNRVYEGIYGAMKRLQFHEKTDKWEYPMEYYSNNNSMPWI
jgi:hypothetical protein